MPEVTVTRNGGVTSQVAWDFVSDMDNWAPLLTGYQSHETIDETRSRWTVRGELAGLTRLADFDVTITDWVEPERIVFSLEGLTEPFTGHGEFRIADGADVAPEPAPAPGIIARFLAWLTRLVLSREDPSAAASVPAATGGCDLRCTLRVDAHGGSGPMINLLLPGILSAVAEDTADRIVAEIAARQA